MNRRPLRIALIVLVPLALLSVAWFLLSRPATDDPQIETREAAPQPRLIEGGGLPPGCTCHSNNPRFVSMHNLFSIRDCGKCHGQEEDLMNKKSEMMTAERKAALEQRMQKEAVCRECHRGGKIIVTEKSEISGRLFCPQEQKMLRRDAADFRDAKYYCPKHGIELIDIDEIAVKSAKEPRNEYCIACHPDNGRFREQHANVQKTAQGTAMQECLKCHSSHSNCGGCHF